MKRNDLIDFLNSGGNFSDKIVSSSIDVYIYSFKRLCKDIIKTKAFSFEISNFVGSYFKVSGKLSLFNTDISESSFPDAAA